MGTKRKAKGAGAKKGDTMRRFNGKDYVTSSSYKFKSKAAANKYAGRHRGKIGSRGRGLARVTKEKGGYRVWARHEYK